MDSIKEKTSWKVGDKFQADTDSDVFVVEEITPPEEHYPEGILWFYCGFCCAAHAIKVNENTGSNDD